MESGVISVRTDRIVVNPSTTARMRLLVFHHAGASAAAMLPVVRHLRGDVEVVIFEMPGRGVRSAAPRAGDFAHVCEDLGSRVRPLLDRPVLLFGHSLGGLIVDAITRSMRAWELDRVSRVIISASRRPPEVEKIPLKRRSVPELEQQLRGLAGTPPVVFETPDLLSYCVGALGDDMELFDSVGAMDDLPPAPVDCELWFGEEDLSVPKDSEAVWAARLSRTPTVRRFPGSHFYLFEDPLRVIAQLHEILAAELGPAVGDA